VVVKMVQSLAGRLAAAAMLWIVVASTAHAQNVVAFVNGDPITALDVEYRTKFIRLSTQKEAKRADVINELIDEKLKIKEGARWSIEPTDEEVNATYAGMANRMHQTPEQLTQNLLKAGVGASTLKSRIRADLVWQQLVRGRYSSRLQVSDKDIEAALAAKAQSGQPEPAAVDYTMRPILFLVPPGSPSGVYENRRKDAEALRARFRSCEDGIAAARMLRDVTVRPQIIRSSGDLSEPLRKIIDAVPIGQLTAPEVTKLGIEMFALCNRQESKDDTPEKRRAREAMVSKLFAQQSKLYLRRLRHAAMIERR
jgi:peptidyl-prolyl cis-trans isomerase SurA